MCVCTSNGLHRPYCGRIIFHLSPNSKNATWKSNTKHHGGSFSFAVAKWWRNPLFRRRSAGPKYLQGRIRNFDFDKYFSLSP